MKQEKIECKIASNIKADMQSTQRLMHFKTIGEYLTFTHQTIINISSQAKIGGIAKENMQEFIDWLLNCQNFQNEIIKYAGIFLETHKAKEKLLKKD
jgi:hypothetical protein